MRWYNHPQWYVLLITAVLFSGCNPRQPIYRRGDGQLANYLDKATDLEFPDVEISPLAEVTQAHEPLSIQNNQFGSFWDLRLEEAIATALLNNKLIRGYGTPGLQDNRVAPGVDNLINNVNQAGTMYNAAIRETEPGIIGTPGQISPAGNIPTNTSLDVNQGVEAALAEFDAQFTSALNWERLDRPRNTILDSNNNVFNQDQVNFQTELSKKTATGTQFFLRNVTGYTSNNLPGTLQALPSFYSTSLEAEFRQPLLRGRGELINRMPVIFARINTDQELANLEGQLQNMVANVEIRYWDLYAAYRNYQAAQDGFNSAHATWKVVNENLKVRERSVAEEAQAREQYFFFRAEKERAYTALLDAENNLRFLMGIAMTDGRLIRPADEPTEAAVVFNWYDAMDEALTFQPSLRQERWELKKRQLAVSHSKNALLPNLNVTGMYRLIGLGENLISADGTGIRFPNPGSEAWEDLSSGDYQEGRLGIEFGMPVGYRRELSNVRNAQLKLARQFARLEDMELDASRELTQALRALNTNYRMAQTHFNRWVASTTAAESVLENYKLGTVALDALLEAQRGRSQSQVAYYTALTEYNKSIALVHRRKGTTLDYCGVTFAEGPWVGKAYVDAQEHARRRGASREMNYAFTRPAVVSQGPHATRQHANGDWSPEMMEGETIPSDVVFEEGGELILEGEISNETTLELEGYDSWEDAGDTLSQESTNRNQLRQTTTVTRNRPSAPRGTGSFSESPYAVQQVSATEPEVVRQAAPATSQRRQSQSYRPTRKSVAQIKAQ
ncbi:MAG: TolC family protein [Planctomycetaceae bacterium]|nr:TolC family protein [Planctomycetaceae bacterium]